MMPVLSQGRIAVTPALWERADDRFVVFVDRSSPWKSESSPPLYKVRPQGE